MTVRSRSWWLRACAGSFDAKTPETPRSEGFRALRAGHDSGGSWFRGWSGSFDAKTPQTPRSEGWALRAGVGSRVGRIVVGALLVVLVACQGERSEAPVARDATASTRGDAGGFDGSGSTGAGGGSEGSAGSAEVGSGSGAAAEPEEPPDTTPNAGSAGAVDPIADLGAVPAWQAVIDRYLYLARRNQEGIVYGRVGPRVLVEKIPLGAIDGGIELVPSQYTWLIDDTDGNGSLGIRVALGGRDAKAGDRVALGGGWKLDETRQWFWEVDAFHPLPPAAPSNIKDPPPETPSHVIVDGSLPSGARPVTLAKDNDAIYFQIVGPPPLKEGDGWLIANELGDPPFARLVLPGEKSSYGSQDMRGDDERWVLKKGQTYWVRIGKVRTYGPDKPAGMNARTAPVRVK